MNTLIQYHRHAGQFLTRFQPWAAAALALGLRIYLGWIFFKAGLTKIADWSTTLALFRDEYQVPLLPPEIAAIMGTAGELMLPVLLWAGLMTRLVAVGLSFVNLMAVVSYPLLFTFDCPAALNDHRYWGVLLIVLIIMGPGRLSADAILQRKA